MCMKYEGASASATGARASDNRAEKHLQNTASTRMNNGNFRRQDGVYWYVQLGKSLLNGF